MLGSTVRVLIIEDELRLARVLKRGLEADGHAVDLLVRGELALERAAMISYDAFVLDVMLPGMDGFATCAALREAGIWAPVMMLTARDAVDDRVRGLDCGADDYLTKPFSFAELSARLRALARRSPVERPAVIEAGGLVLDPASMTASRDGVEVKLSTKEFSLLETLMRRAGQVVSRYSLLEHAWDYGYESRSNVVDVYIRYLRQKIDRPFGTNSIETVRGAGYRFRREPPA
jgi:two-component system OmpR family response regulator